MICLNSALLIKSKTILKESNSAPDIAMSIKEIATKSPKKRSLRADNFMVLATTCATLAGSDLSMLFTTSLAQSLNSYSSIPRSLNRLASRIFSTLALAEEPRRLETSRLAVAAFPSSETDSLLGRNSNPLPTKCPTILAISNCFSCESASNSSNDSPSNPYTFAAERRSPLHAITNSFSPNVLSVCCL